MAALPAPVKTGRNEADAAITEKVKGIASVIV